MSPVVSLFTRVDARLRGTGTAREEDETAAEEVEEEEEEGIEAEVTISHMVSPEGSMMEVLVLVWEWGCGWEWGWGGGWVCCDGDVFVERGAEPHVMGVVVAENAVGCG